MSYRVFAMDTYFYTPLGAYEFDARCEILRELGYDAGYLTTWSEASWNDVPRVAGVRARFGINMSAVYATLELAADSEERVNNRIVRLIETLEGCDRIELAARDSNKNLRNSDASHDGKMLRWLERMLPVAERRGITIALYPHMNFWLERIEDAVRLCEKVKHPRLRAVFCGFHWYAADGQQLGARLELAAPWLAAVNLCGSRRPSPPASGMLPSIEPLDQGDLDNFAVLGWLRKVGYRGEIGFQGFAIGGDVDANLRRSLEAFRDMERRLEKHPNWATMREG